MHLAGVWSGRYLVWPIDMFLKLDLTAEASGRSEEAKRLRSPHETARVDRGDLGVTFPLRAAYDWWNEKLEAKNRHEARPGPVGDPLRIYLCAYLRNPGLHQVINLADYMGSVT